ncbi:MAG TPA: cell filamentation protein Fic [Betaproteobacteria bacterium]|nr:cell filamentation protein Fic [Betaproteobacteria bacterium]
MKNIKNKDTITNSSNLVATESKNIPTELQEDISQSSSHFLFYSANDGAVKVQVILGDETVWSSQKGMAEIFGVNVRTINEHLQNIFKSNEIDENSVIRKFRITASDRKNYDINFYNLDAIISIGYRVNSYQATQFRKWATKILKEYLIKGFVLNDDRLKQGNQLFGKDYFDELLERVREIRASERRFYQKITDIYSQCSIDYDKDAPITHQFYAHVQDKLHYATHGHTSAELIRLRADASRPHMGLSSYKNAKHGGKVTKSDVTVGKNYLTPEEIENLERLVSMYLDFAENFARRHIPMQMHDWAEKLDNFLTFNAYEVLGNYGSTKRDIAEKIALSEYEKFRVIQDKEYQSDFDKVVDEIKISKRLPKSKKS